MITWRSISFTGPLAAEVHFGRKTMTRRIVKLKTRVPTGGMIANAALPTADGGWQFWFGPRPPSRREYDFMASESAKKTDGFTSPYGKPGDKLWVREPWIAPVGDDERSPARLPHKTRVHYLADGPKPSWGGRYRHPRFMPRRLSRTALVLREVRPERVQSASIEDIAAEGVTAEVVRALWFRAPRGIRRALAATGVIVVAPAAGGAGVGMIGPTGDLRHATPRDLWRIGWSIINGVDSWTRNEWCWVHVFERTRLEKE